MKGSEHEAEQLLHRYQTAILTTRGVDGHFHGRPMAMSRQPQVSELWFATSAETSKVDELEENPECAVSLHGGGQDPSYVSISGHGRVVRDREKIHELWEPAWKAWFPDGPDQPDLALIHITPEHVEYVNGRGGALKVMATTVKAALTRSPVDHAPKKEVDVRH